ncbi:hydroxymethylglutaryl-CoA reductase, degradative [Persicimonas caeni]|uniref:3-hydroxy-3-methylglutaryl coenzyme A reductase n=1 Tax=Persicimonas caeni TaxID=2292766 RepID=A0A4Y6PXZ7_PERCE|nr:hydroxymethylglutaryl-CoA reductase, degradative [Persicimonas caeni]QDG52615.1 hydroxymethylglutaryl-CoA reductase, degradative [Persicimonas caeni]QED33837.1 hydroxymethylglutaryl-CoA reductase, degradative [Persicimonas caeni]
MSKVDPDIDSTTEESRPSSRISGFYRMSMDERLECLLDHGIIDEEDASILRERDGGLDRETANKMVENCVGVFELPLGLGLNFTINGNDYVVPMAVEEPSVIAAVSHCAKIVRQSGGFESECKSNVMIGQVQVVGCTDFEAAQEAILAHRSELVELANSFEPNMVARGGGAKDIEVRILDGGDYRKMLVVHLLIDAVDAMGANLINTMAEGIAPRVEELTGGKVFLRILSNLADKRLVRSRCKIPFGELAWKGYSGREVAEGIAYASQFAETDPYRATTHNKGIMNGISSVCIATGNDWRAVEAGCHAYCCRDGQYRPMAVWYIEDECLVGELEVPMQVGTVGGPIRLHPTVQLAHRVLRVETASELAEVMGAVGLAQNLGALKALATEGIQRGHMSLHARSVAATAGATSDEMSQLVERLIEGGDIKVSRAKELLVELRSE